MPDELVYPEHSRTDSSRWNFLWVAQSKARPWPTVIAKPAPFLRFLEGLAKPFWLRLIAEKAVGIRKILLHKQTECVIHFTTLIWHFAVICLIFLGLIYKTISARFRNFFTGFLCILMQFHIQMGFGWDVKARRPTDKLQSIWVWGGISLFSW